MSQPNLNVFLTSPRCFVWGSKLISSSKDTLAWGPDRAPPAVIADSDIDRINCSIDLSLCFMIDADHDK